MTTATQSEFSALIGKDKSYVTRLKQAGRLVLTADGKVDIEKSRALIASTADPSRNAAVEARINETMRGESASRSTGSGQTSQQENIGNSYQTAKAINEKYKALTAKLEYERASEKLVEAEAVRLFAADLGATFRGALEILPDRIAAELVPLSDIDAIRAVLVEAFEQVLLDLSQKIEKGLI